MLPFFLTILSMAGCISQQSDLKQTERNPQQRIKQSNDESAQTRARQELPQLRVELERARHEAQELQGKQDNLKQLSAELEQQTKRLERLTGKAGAEDTTRSTEIEKTLNDQTMRNDVAIGMMLLRLEELEKSVKALEQTLEK